METKWAFVSWSYGGAVSHNISTPPNDKTYTATFNGLPTVSVTSPANGAIFTEPSSITIKANAADVDGSIARVEFYRGSTFLGEDTTAPYQFIFNNPLTGSYNLKAIAIDDLNASTTSAVIPITVNANNAPTASITSPASGANFTAPANITVNASAADGDGTISKVEFFRGST